MGNFTSKSIVRKPSHRVSLQITCPHMNIGDDELPVFLSSTKKAAFLVKGSREIKEQETEGDKSSKPVHTLAFSINCPENGL